MPYSFWLEQSGLAGMHAQHVLRRAAFCCLAFVFACQTVSLCAHVAPVIRASPPRRTSIQVRPSGQHSTLLHAQTLDDWLQLGRQHQGLLLARKPFWKDCQSAVDRMDWQRILVRACRSPQSASLRAAAQELLHQVMLPSDISAAIQADVCEVGAVVHRLCPWSDSLHVKLERVGENCCTRWHRDNYSGRAIVSYNSAATMYAPDHAIDLWQLENGGGNEKIIKDESKCRSVSVGDVFFMKGKKFPTRPKGLVHKSPEIQYHCDGSVVQRLVLKIDVP